MVGKKIKIKSGGVYMGFALGTWLYILGLFILPYLV